MARLPRQKEAMPCSAATREKQLPMPARDTQACQAAGITPLHAHPAICSAYCTTSELVLLKHPKYCTIYLRGRIQRARIKRIQAAGRPKKEEHVAKVSVPAQLAFQNMLL